MSEYKTEGGVYFTKGLFYEWNNPDAEFSLRDTGKDAYYVARSGKKYRSLPYLYRNSESEYDCAISVLGSWEHWKKLSKIEWFQTGKVNGTTFTGLNDWRAEKDLADEAAAKRVLMQAIEEGDLQAAKFMYDKATKKEAASKRGRPEKKTPVKNKGSVVDLAKRIGNKG